MSSYTDIVADLTNEDEYYAEVYRRTKIPIQSVQLSATSLSQIVHHCVAAEYKFGQLFGFGIDGVLEVTYAHPIPSVEDEGEFLNLLKLHLNDIGVDDNVVGFYGAGSLSNFFDRKFLRDLFRMQAENANCVALIYDPLLTQEGDLGIRAYRLTDSFFEYLGSKSRGNDFPFDQVLENLPILVKTTSFENCILAVMKGDSRLSSLNVKDNNIIEQSLDELSNLISTVQKEDSARTAWTKKVVDLTKKQDELISQRVEENKQRKKMVNLPYLKQKKF